jgi:hypothetical protein
LALAAAGFFGEIAARNRTSVTMTTSASPRRIYWPSVITVVSAAILIGAEVFGAAFAGGWALSVLFGLDSLGEHILQVVLFLCGVAVMAAFLRTAARIEPFTRRG